MKDSMHARPVARQPMTNSPSFALLSGLTLAVISLIGASIADHFWPDGAAGPLAARALFENGNVFWIVLVAIVLGPAFETLVGQLAPVCIARRITTKRPAWIVAGASVFSLGHVVGGGGALQALITLLFGAIFTAFYVHWLGEGQARAFSLTMIVHATHNAALLLFSYASFT